MFLRESAPSSLWTPPEVCNWDLFGPLAILAGEPARVWLEWQDAAKLN